MRHTETTTPGDRTPPPAHTETMPERQLPPTWTSSSWHASSSPVPWWLREIDDLGPVTLDRPVGKLATMGVQVDDDPDVDLDELIRRALAEVYPPPVPGCGCWTDADEPPLPGGRHRAEATVSDQSAGAKITGTTS